MATAEFSKFAGILSAALSNRLLEGTNKTLGTPGPRRKEQLTHKRLTRVPVNVQESLVEALVGGGLLQSWGH